MGKNRTVQYFFGLMLILFLSMACLSTPKGNTSDGIAKKPGVGRGVISNVEPLNNGLTQLWIFGDNTYVFCTLDEDLANKLKSIVQEENATIVYEYRDWLNTDIEYVTRDSSGSQISTTCGQGIPGSHGSKLLSVRSITEIEGTPRPTVIHRVATAIPTTGR